MNSDEHNTNNQNHTDDANSDPSEFDDIPTLTQEIPVVDQQIPVLHEIVENEEDLIPELTVLADESEDSIPELTDRVEEIQPVVIHSQVSDRELEQQQWQIEQQAFVQRGDWHALADVEPSASITSKEPVQQTDNIELNEEQEAVLEASWQRLESLIMDNMPAEIAGSYLSVLEQHFATTKESIARDISLLDENDLESILDFYQIDRGF